MGEQCASTLHSSGVGILCEPECQRSVRGRESGDLQLLCKVKITRVFVPHNLLLNLLSLLYSISKKLKDNNYPSHILTLLRRQILK
jgi:hypothetical protein